MGTRAIIEINTGHRITEGQVTGNAQAKMAALVKSKRYRWEDEPVAVSASQALEIFELERQRLVAESERLDAREQELNERFAHLISRERAVDEAEAAIKPAQAAGEKPSKEGAKGAQK